MFDDYLDAYEGKTVLVTGGAGCIGSNLVGTLARAGAARVLALDDLSAASRWNVPVEPNVVFIKGSVLDDQCLKQAFSQKIDYVFHLAAHFANQNSVDSPETDLMVNGQGTIKVLQYSHIARVSRVVFASSGCSVYGSQAPLPLKEDYVSLHLDTPYQITKLLGELYCNFFHNFYGLPVAIARYFNVFGPGEIPGAYRNVIPNFIWWAMQQKPLPITGNGEETRDFTFVEDIVDGTLRMGIVPEAVGQAFNLASERETTILEVAGIVNGLTENGSGTTFTARRDWDQIVRRRASIARAAAVLGYAPKTNVPDGIARAFDWITENKDRIRQDARF